MTDARLVFYPGAKAVEAKREGDNSPRSSTEVKGVRVEIYFHYPYFFMNWWFLSTEVIFMQFRASK
jgi:hypothetical protein